MNKEDKTMTKDTMHVINNEESCKPGMMIKIDGCNVEIHGTEAQQKACAASIMLALYYASKTDNNLKSVCRQWARESDEIMEQIRKLDI